METLGISVSKQLLKPQVWTILHSASSQFIHERIFRNLFGSHQLCRIPVLGHKSEVGSDTVLHKLVYMFAQLSVKTFCLLFQSTFDLSLCYSRQKKTHPSCIFLYSEVRWNNTTVLVF